jgi:hypothetical protein
MDGWVNAWMDGWMDGWMGGWIASAEKQCRQKPHAVA